jgi:hypothetical protein
MEGRWEYIAYAVADIRQGVVLQLGALDEVLTTPQSKNLPLTYKVKTYHPQRYQTWTVNKGSREHINFSPPKQTNHTA